MTMLNQAATAAKSKNNKKKTATKQTKNAKLITS